MERTTHILLLAYPLQGHINPLLQFSKRLVSKGVRVTFVTTTSIGNSMEALSGHSISVEIISDGSENGKDSESLDAVLERYRLHVSQSLAKLFEKHNSSQYAPKMVVYDSFMPWVLDIARQFGIDGAPFFTQSCVINAIYYHANHGAIQMPIEEGASISLPSIPSLRINDLPSFLCDKGLYPALLKLVLNQFSNILEANWLLFNTFNELENEVVNWMTSQQWRVKTIGPTIPSIYLDNRLEDDKEIKLDERGIATKEEIELCIREVIEGERGKQMKINSIRWKELAKEAVDKGGSSDKNIEEFVAKLSES
nr:udp-glycosyltransferase 74e1 [Quercus suber]